MPAGRRWWQHPALIISALVVLPPAGIALAWTSGWSKGKKVVATVLAGLWFFAPFMGDPPKKSEADAKPKTAVAQTSSAAPTPTASATPSASPTPAATPTDPLMPAVIGKPFSEAEKAVEDLIERELRALSAYNDVELPGSYADWVVCFQGPAAGTKIVAQYADPSVHLVAPGTACPATTSTDLHAKPEPTQDGNDDDSSTSSSGGSSTGGGGGGTVTPGAYCSTPGATGTGKTNGKLYTCKGPSPNRWRR
ncbi:hypothetical protein [Streptomyces sp. NPDC054849]